MHRHPEEVLSQCLDETLAVQESIERVVEASRQDAGELRELLRLAHRLRAASLEWPSDDLQRVAKVRLLARLAPGPGESTVADRMRAWVSTANLLVPRRMEMKSLLIAALGLFTLGGGAGVAYAADGAVPGSPLYGLDRAIEKVQWQLTSSPAGQAQLGLSMAEERLLELQTLAAARAAEDLLQIAGASYGESVHQAAAALAAVAAEGGEARTQAVANVITAAQAIHAQVVSDVIEGMPEQAQGGPPEGVPVGAPEDEDLAEEQPLSFEERVAGLETFLTQAQVEIAEGDLGSARIQLLAFEIEVDALAQELASVAEDDATRAQALAVLLDEALMIHKQVLTQLMTQVPAGAAVWIQKALEASQGGLETVAGLIGESMPGGQPDGVPDGPPEGYGR